MNINSTPRIALVGNGSMGKEISRIAGEQGIHITHVFDEQTPLNPSSPSDFDVVIDFSTPHAVLSTIQSACELRKNVVIGTTGWLEHLPVIKQLVEKHSIGVIYGSNYSIGMQMFFRIVRQAARLVNSSQEYDIFMQEIHHKRKLDSPSGTALSLGDIIVAEVDRKSTLYTDTSHGKISPEVLHISSVRGGEVTGTHSVYVDSVADTIELTHRAKNRSGFASGALVAAEWIWKKQGLFDFADQFENIIVTRSLA